MLWLLHCCGCAYSTLLTYFKTQLLSVNAQFSISGSGEDKTYISIHWKAINNILYHSFLTLPVGRFWTGHQSTFTLTLIPRGLNTSHIMTTITQSFLALDFLQLVLNTSSWQSFFPVLSNKHCVIGRKFDFPGVLHLSFLGSMKRPGQKALFFLVLPPSENVQIYLFSKYLQAFNVSFGLRAKTKYMIHSSYPKIHPVDPFFRLLQWNTKVFPKEISYYIISIAYQCNIKKEQF